MNESVSLIQLFECCMTSKQTLILVLKSNRIQKNNISVKPGQSCMCATNNDIFGVVISDIKATHKMKS